MTYRQAWRQATSLRKSGIGCDVISIRDHDGALRWYVELGEAK